MAQRIMDAETERLARTLAERTGESVVIATRRALEERLRRIGEAQVLKARLEEMAASRHRFAALPVLDDRPSDDILGYNKNGSPS